MTPLLQARKTTKPGVTRGGGLIPAKYGMRLQSNKAGRRDPRPPPPRAPPRPSLHRRKRRHIACRCHLSEPSFFLTSSSSRSYRSPVPIIGLCVCRTGLVSKMTAGLRLSFHEKMPQNIENLPFAHLAQVHVAILTRLSRYSNPPECSGSHDRV